MEYLSSNYEVKITDIELIAYERKCIMANIKAVNEKILRVRFDSSSEIYERIKEAYPKQYSKIKRVYNLEQMERYDTSSDISSPHTKNCYNITTDF